MKYVHTNIISQDWKNLVKFYVNVFNCRPISQKRDMSGKWLEKGTGVPRASLKGIHLLLPGYGNDGPTLEIFQYSQLVEKRLPSVANREGYGHIAFSVDDVEKVLKQVIEEGGKKIGEISQKKFESGTLIFSYVADPEGNIIELQKWTTLDI